MRSISERAAGTPRAPLAPSAARARRRRRVIAALTVLAAASLVAYLAVDIDFANERLLAFALRIRLPKAAAMLVAGTAIGASSIVFQSITGNTIVTPALLGMNSLYTLLHTVVFFFAGSSSILAVDGALTFAVDLAVMGTVSLLIYGRLFSRVGNSILYVLLIGTVLSSLFGSVQSTLVRVMDPNEYDALLATIVPGFSNLSWGIVLASAALLALTALALRRELALLDVITLGRDRAVNLGVDYDRVVRRLLLGVALATAAATALVGPLTFLGLVAANLARQLLKTYRHDQLVAASGLLAVAIIAAGQLVIEQVYTYAIPLSVFVNVFGGCYFLYLLLSSRKA
ncbi:MAG: CRISPR-associated protein Cas5 [Coriobacteriaceae bacterium]|nr:CRISPR-associated protein Cas5 [Coriobacteriaceae bacterium]